MQLQQMDLARWQRVFATNVFGSFSAAVKRSNACRPARAAMAVPSSTCHPGCRPDRAPGEYIDYAAAKGAIDSMTLGLAKEVAAEGIRVNAVRPGVIATEIHASGGEPGRSHASARVCPWGAAAWPVKSGRGDSLAGQRARVLHQRRTTGCQRRALIPECNL